MEFVPPPDPEEEVTFVMVEELNSPQKPPRRVLDDVLGGLELEGSELAIALGGQRGVGHKVLGWSMKSHKTEP